MSKKSTLPLSKFVRRHKDTIQSGVFIAFILVFVQYVPKLILSVNSGLDSLNLLMEFAFSLVLLSGFLYVLSHLDGRRKREHRAFMSLYTMLIYYTYMIVGIILALAAIISMSGLMLIIACIVIVYSIVGVFYWAKQARK